MPKPKTPAAEYARLTVRLPPDLLLTLREEADEGERPLNTHIIRLLRFAMRESDPLSRRRRPSPAQS